VVTEAIAGCHIEQAPGLDGFTGAFFKSYWGIIKHGVMVVVNEFPNLCTNNLSLV
jgi:hypothetical protein